MSDRQISSQETAHRQGWSGAPLPPSGREWLFWLLVLVLLAIPVSTLIMIFRLYYDVPWGDHLSLFLVNRLQDGLTFQNLFRFHNEHQIVWTKILIYSDYKFLHGSNLLPYVASTAAILGICLFYCWMLQRFGNLRDRRKLLVAAGIIVMLYFNGRMLWTITCPIMFEHPSTALFALGAFFAFSRLPFSLGPDQRSGARPRMSTVLLVIIMATAYAGAATSSATGVLVGPAMLVVFAGLLIWSRLFPIRAAVQAGAVALLATMIVVGIYTAAYYNSATGRHLPLNNVHILDAIRFPVLFVGAAFFRDSTWPIEHHADPFLMYSVAALFWLLLVWIAVQLYRRRQSVTSFEIFHACVIAFVLFAATTGGMFRADLSSLEGINKKYVPNALLAWVSAASLLIYIRPQALFGVRPSSWARPLVMCSAAVLLLVPGNLTEFRVWQDWDRQVKEAASAAASGVYSEALLRRFYFDQAGAYQTVQSFTEDRAYCYRRMPPTGYLLSERFHVVGGQSERLRAEITPVEDRPEMDGFTAAGSSANLATGGFPSLLITDSDSRVIGYGNSSSIAPEGVPLKNERVWFAAFRPRNTAAGEKFRVYEIDGTSVRLAGEMSLPAKPPASFPASASAVRLSRVPDHMDYVLELFNGVRNPLIEPPVRVSTSGDISLTGWAADRVAGTSVAGLEVLIDRKPFQARLGLSRPDIQAYFRQPGFTYTGFSFKMPAAELAAGRHELRLRIYTNGGKSYLETGVFLFFLE